MDANIVAAAIDCGRRNRLDRSSQARREARCAAQTPRVTDAYVLDAYRKVERHLDREVSRESLDDLESAIADVQLLGSEAQISGDCFVVGGGLRRCALSGRQHREA